MPSPAPKKLRILCFGNSLTAGYCAWGLDHFPYADHLPTPLQKLWPETSIEIDVAALSGDRVVGGQYLRRLESRLGKAGASQNPYDWVIIMGGTNDLGWGCLPDRLYEGLKICWKKSLDTGASVLALNIIEASYPSQSLRARRSELNTLIANHKEERWYSLDLCSAIPYFALDEKRREDIWDDGIHLTEEGYRLMGEAVAARLVEILSSHATESDDGPGPGRIKKGSGIGQREKEATEP